MPLKVNVSPDLFFCWEEGPASGSSLLLHVDEVYYVSNRISHTLLPFQCQLLYVLSRYLSNSECLRSWHPVTRVCVALTDRQPKPTHTFVMEMLWERSVLAGTVCVLAVWRINAANSICLHPSSLG